MSIIGSSLEAVRRDLKYMPTQTLIQYKQNPAKNAVDGIPLDMLAGLELSRRAQMQTELSAAGAQSAANMPTVTDAAVQQLTGQPQQPPAPMPQGAPQPAPQPQQAAPQPQPQPQPQQPPPPTDAQVQQGPMQQTPQGGLPTVKKAVGGFIIDSPDDLHNLLSGKRDLLKTEGYAGGGIIAFNGERRSNVPSVLGIGSDEYNEIDPRDMPKNIPTRTAAEEEEKKLRWSWPWESEADEAVRRKKLAEVSARVEAEKKAAKGEKQIPIEDSAATPPPPPGIAPPSQTALTEGLRKLLATPTGGGIKSNFKVPDLKVPDLPDRSVANANIESLANETAQETNARRAYENFAADQARRKSPFMTDAERAAAEDVQFKKRQEIYDPVNAETQKVLDERKTALEARRGRRLSEAGLQLGLGMLGGRGNLASIISNAGKEAVGTYQKGQELDDAQNERIQDMHLKQQQALAAQKAGNMDLAYQRTREAQADKLAIDNFEVAKQKDILAAQQKAAEVAGNVRGRQMTAAVHLDNVQNALDKAKLGFDMTAQLAEAKFNMQLELHRLQSANADLGRQMQLMSFLHKVEESQRKAALGQIPELGARVQAEKLIDSRYADNSTALNSGIASLKGGDRLLADYQRDPARMKTEYDRAAQIVRDNALRKLISETRTPGAPMSVGEAEAAVR